MKSSGPLLIDTGKGFTIKYKGRYLYSSIEPLSSIRKRVSSLALPGKTLIFVPSLGLGYGLGELLLKLPADSHILCIEVDQRLMALALEARNTISVQLPEDPRLTIIRTDQIAGAVRTLRSIGVWNFRKLMPLHLSGGFHLYRDTYRDMQQALEAEIRTYWQNKMTLIKMSHLWLKNLFQNLRIINQAADLGGLSSGKPLLVAGAGPSLEDSLAWINKIRHNVLLLAVDTALPVLMEVGIKPDYVFMLESQLTNLQDFLPHRDPEIALICDLTASPLAIRLFGNRVFFCSSRFHPLKLFDRLKNFGLLPAVIPPLGSVGVASVHTALKMTGGPVIITGLDFSYCSHKTHARGAPVNRIMHQTSSRLRPAGMLSYELIQKRPLLKLKGKNGNPVVSDLVLHSYSLNLNQEISGTGRVFDIARRGLPNSAQPVRSETELLQICSGAFPLSPKYSATAFSPSREAVSKFYRQELKLLLQAEEGLKAGLDRQESAEGPLSETARVCLKEVEYTVLHFPDAVPEFPAGSNFMIRALHSVRRYLALLRRLAE